MKNNRGYATLEGTIVMAITMLIVLMVIFLFMDTVLDGKIWEDCYGEIYTFSMEDVSKTGVSYEDFHVVVDTAKINCGYSGFAYRYETGQKIFETEYDICSNRLRRWQLYGDVLSE